MPRPTRAQLRFLLDLVASGGKGYGIDMVRTHQTINACKTAGWVEYWPVKEFEIGKHVITESGRRAAIDAAPDAYAKRLAQAVAR